ncbi:MAG: acireductone synthase [Leptospiraceae bacterium]|nr:acireductone synthase [Leptospiraceae bacterium]MDW8307696.1 acireductone synthase [Leptospiraceae bacterium]
MPILWILCDIEGTTTSLAFVQEVLFPISYKKLPEFLAKKENWDLFSSEFHSLAAHGIDTRNIESLTSYFRELMDKDVKDPLLKKIQGKIWKAAYENKEIRGHVYDDVLPAWERWQRMGKKIGIYSSGSVEAQQLLFRYSEKGDLTRWISAYFDTGIGPKKDTSSYQRISTKLNCQPQEILFLSDSVEELEAAKKAHLAVARILRPGVEERQSLNIPQLKKFDEIDSLFLT